MKELVILLFNEIGLDIDSKSLRIRDQDTGQYLIFGRKYIKYDENNLLNNDDINFDLNDEKLLNHIFGYYCMKMEQDEDDPFTVKHFSDFIERDGGISKMAIAVTIESRGVITSISSDFFSINNKALRFIDVICKLNHSIVDLSKYDI